MHVDSEGRAQPIAWDGRPWNQEAICRGRSRLGKKNIEALLISTLHHQQLVRLLARLDPFRDDARPQASRQCDDALDDSRMLLSRGEAADERAIDLDFVHRETVKVTQ